MIVTTRHNYEKSDSMWDFSCMLSLTSQCIMDEKIPYKNILMVIDNHGSLPIDDVRQNIKKSFRLLRSGDKLKIYGVSDLDNCTPMNKQVWCNTINTHEFKQSNGWQYENYALNPIDGVIVVTDSPNEMDTSYYKYPVHVIAFGNNEGKSYKLLSDTTHGTYNYLVHNDEFPRALGSSIGAIFSTVYKDIVIEFTSTANKIITPVKRIDNLYSQEKRDIIIPCVPIVPNNNDIKYTIRAFDILRNKVVHCTGQIDLSITNMGKDCIIERLTELTALNNMDKTANGYIKDDIEDVLSTRGIKHKCLLERLSQEYITQRDNRSDKMSKYSTPFRMWYGRELSK